MIRVLFFAAAVLLIIFLARNTYTPLVQVKSVAAKPLKAAGASGAHQAESATTSQPFSFH